MKKFISVFSIASMLLSGVALIGGEPSEAPQHIAVGTKPNKKHAKKGSRGAAAARHSAKREKSPLADVKISVSPKFFYTIKSVGPRGKTLITTDETIWEIASRDAAKLTNWLPNSAIVIMPNYKWFSSYDYMLINKWTNESVGANLSQGPYISTAIFINNIDHGTGMLSLSNGSIWKAETGAQFAYWRIGQAVLIGENDTWFGKPNILININKNNFVTAKPK